ncbi:hypothetical protein CORC01_00533 [Colletotrichum orchidophilum]|uniref:Uncharacterized protein n=1 Tax=Colletotrichum orchidophilum TaxID=1209926 RepID=A0A1G4BRW2_9PEZI|nr:uncharacterized protein CORC01_00533 [Colletotrichum orchidophilum]OHF04194.1 hypothetical protein CORC01_00533 [Colletotrichum orchidophilum]
MKGVHTALGGVVVTFIALVQGNSDIVSLSTNGAAYIQEASATLILPKLPSSVSGDVSIWSAIMMEQHAYFLQGVTSNSPSGSYCNNGGNSWCNFAFSLVGMTPTAGDPVTASPGSTIRTHYKLNSATNLWDQNVYVNDKLASSVSSSKGQKGNLFYISIECASGSCAAHPAHSWEDISIVLSQADKSFGHTGGWKYGATGGEMSSPDGGKTWNFSTLNVPAQKAG